MKWQIDANGNVYLITSDGLIYASTEWDGPPPDAAAFIQTVKDNCKTAPFVGIGPRPNPLPNTYYLNSFLFTGAGFVLIFAQLDPSGQYDQALLTVFKPFSNREQAKASMSEFAQNVLAATGP
jgi:hypothetical protein